MNALYTWQSAAIDFNANEADEIWDRFGLGVTYSTATNLYKWNTAPFDWTRVQTNETWDTFGIYEHERYDTHLLSITDTRKAIVAILVLDAIALQDRINHQHKSSVLESIAVQETYWDYIRYLMNILENCTVQEKASNHFYQPNSEADIGISDDETGCVGKNISEAIDLAELLKRRFKVKRDFTETASVVEYHTNHYTLNESELIALTDKLMRAANAVIADVAITDEAMSLDDFKSLANQPGGYEPFIPYVVGEYEYERALVRLKIVAGSQGAEPVIYDAVIHVDIDDTVDRGTAEVTDTTAATKVYLNKHYYTKPEITVTLYSGNTKDGVITPVVTEIASDDAGYYFLLELRKTNDELTTGTVTWMAVGY